MKVQVIIPAAGKGLRLKTATAKPLVLLKDKPIVVYSLEAFQKSSLIDSIILAVDKKYLFHYIEVIRRYKLTKVKKVVIGGETRRESVSHGLHALDSNTELVVIHDAARPFVTKELIQRAISIAKKEKAAVVAVPVKSTIKAVDASTLKVQKTLNRNTLWEIQTPQVFKKEIILKAHEKIKDKNPSDDALLVEKFGIKVKVVMGDYKNIKITTSDDLVFARAILDSRRN